MNKPISFMRVFLNYFVENSHRDTIKSVGYVYGAQLLRLSSFRRWRRRRAATTAVTAVAGSRKFQFRASPQFSDSIRKETRSCNVMCLKSGDPALVRRSVIAGASAASWDTKNTGLRSVVVDT